jgi:hypothetical protein
VNWLRAAQEHGEHFPNFLEACTKSNTLRIIVNKKLTFMAHAGAAAVPQQADTFGHWARS